MNMSLETGLNGKPVDQSSNHSTLLGKLFNFFGYGTNNQNIGKQNEQVLTKNESIDKNLPNERSSNTDKEKTFKKHIKVPELELFGASLNESEPKPNDSIALTKISSFKTKRKQSHYTNPLTSRKTIRINPNSSSSSVSLTPPPDRSRSTENENLHSSKQSPSISRSSIHEELINLPHKRASSITSSPHRSISHSIHVNTVDDLNEDPIIDNHEQDHETYNSGRGEKLEDNITITDMNIDIEKIEKGSKKEKKKKRSKDGHKRKKRRESRKNTNISQVEEVTPDMATEFRNEVNIVGNGGLFFDNFHNDTNQAGDNDLGPEVTESQSPVIKWPGHNSIVRTQGTKNTDEHLRTPTKRKNEENIENINGGKKPRLLSEIMAERYRKDGIEFLGDFGTQTWKTERDSTPPIDSSSEEEKKFNSPIFKKFGISIQKSPTKKRRT